MTIPEVLALCFSVAVGGVSGGVISGLLMRAALRRLDRE